MEEYLHKFFPLQFCLICLCSHLESEGWRLLLPYPPAKSGGKKIDTSFIFKISFSFLMFSYSVNLCGKLPYQGKYSQDFSYFDMLRFGCIMSKYEKF